MTTNDGGVIGTTKIVDHGLPAVRWNLVIMGDGYQQVSLPQYQMNVQNFVTAIQSTSPINNLWRSINIYRVDVWSTDSGADDPMTCADGSGGSGVTPRTYFDASFCNDGIRRALKVTNSTATTLANQEVPAWDMIVVLVNSTINGGTGGTVATSSLAGNFSETMIHEMGHTLFNLADEYEYNQGCGSMETGHDDYEGSEPNRPNVTINSNKNTIKWRNLILQSTAVPTTTNANCTQCDPQASPVPSGTVGAFEGGYHYHCGIFRPEFNCKMRVLGEPFCAVCSSIIEKKLSERLGGIIRFTDIVALAAHYGSDADQIQHVIVGTRDGKAREVYWVRSQEEEPGTGVLRQFGANNIVGVAGYYSNGDQHYHVIVGTKQGAVWELYWQGPNPPAGGVLKQFGANNVVAVAGHYADIDQIHHVIVGTRDGKVWELYWQGPNPPGAGVLKEFGANNVVSVAAFYGGADQNHHVFVGTREGKVYELYYQGPIQAITREIAAFPGLGIIGVGAYYNPRDQRTHVIVATTDGVVREILNDPPPPILLTVPYVIGLEAETARQAIVNAALLPIINGPSTIAKVVDQSPRGNALVPIWSNVNLTTSGAVQVPNVYEESPATAAQIVEGVGLVAKFTGSGTWVDRQSPRAGSIVERGTTVTMHVTDRIPP